MINIINFFFHKVRNKSGPEVLLINIFIVVLLFTATPRKGKKKLHNDT